MKGNRWLLWPGNGENEFNTALSVKLYLYGMEWSAISYTLMLLYFAFETFYVFCRCKLSEYYYYYYELINLFYVVALPSDPGWSDSILASFVRNLVYILLDTNGNTNMGSPPALDWPWAATFQCQIQGYLDFKVNFFFRKGGKLGRANRLFYY